MDDQTRDDLLRKVQYWVNEICIAHGKHHTQGCELGEEDDMCLDCWLDSQLENTNTLRITYTYGIQQQYFGCELMLAGGGPNIWLNTREGVVEGYWGSEKVSVGLPETICERIDKWAFESCV